MQGSQESARYGIYHCHFFCQRLGFKIASFTPKCMSSDAHPFSVYNLTVTLTVYGKAIDKIVIKMIIIVFREMAALKKKPL